jgi:NAD-dependent deacetylase
MRMNKLKVVFFTGAGISAESGLQTFRNNPNGLWNEHKIEDVASIEGWENNPELVLKFYNERREQCKSVNPNSAHYLIAELEAKFDVTVVTQNVDDLHERAGSSDVIHLHGELLQARSEKHENLVYDWDKAISLGDLCEKGFQLRPNIVFFGEMLNDSKLNMAMIHAVTCDICIVIGTSLVVYPANQIPQFVDEDAKLVIIDPEEVSMDFEREYYHIKSIASEGMKEVCKVLNKIRV